MGFRFRKSIRILPGIRINLGARGVSTTIGPRGASVNVGPRGTYANVGIPGTGLSSRTKLDAPEHALRPKPVVNAPSTPNTTRTSSHTGWIIALFVGIAIGMMIAGG
jgi:hypothetical protein